MFSGETFIEGENPLSQRIHLLDVNGEYLIRIDFTKEETESTGPFCKPITEILSRKNTFAS